MYKDSPPKGLVFWNWLRANWFFTFLVFAIAATAFGLGLYSTITLKKWDDCDSSNCVSNGCDGAACYQGDCIRFDLPFCLNSSSAAVNSLTTNYTTVNNDLTVNGSVYFQTPGGTATAYNDYEIFHWNFTLYGSFTANQSSVATITHNGNNVFFHFYGNVSAASTNSSVINTDVGALPARFRPTYTLGSGNCIIPLSTNGTAGTGCFTMGSNGRLTISSSSFDCSAVFLNGVTTLKPFFCAWSIS